MRNFQTWLIANGLTQRRILGKEQLERAWSEYVKWLCGTDKQSCKDILKETEGVIEQANEANVLVKLQELETASLQILKDRPQLKQSAPIDKFGNALDARPKPATPQSVAITPPASTKPLPFIGMFPSRRFIADFTEVFAMISSAGAENVKGVSSGKGQYASPGLSIPKDPRDCLRLCNMILSHRIGQVAYHRPVLTCAPIAWGAHAPIYVVSSNRSKWLNLNFKKSTFYGKLIGHRPIIFVVGENEKETYSEILKIKGQGTADGVYVLSCTGGFGMGWNRHCALLHAKSSGQPFAWMLDDNLADIKQSGKSVDDLNDAWIGNHMVMPLYPGIMQQALGFNLGRLEDTNFCPLFTYSKEDLSLSEVLIYLYNQEPFMEPACSVFKVDKTTIKVDFTAGIPGRNQPMARVAALPMWRGENSKPLNLLQVGLDPYAIMKFQEQVLYNCIQVIRTDIPALRALAQTWFVDIGLWDVWD